jgi:uncharacterized protein YjgD (DUF1641 family)
MGVSKHRAKHKTKVKARNKRVTDEKAALKNAQRKYIMDLIKKEQESGAFENNPTINPIVEGPQIDGIPQIDIEGPQL